MTEGKWKFVCPSTAIENEKVLFYWAFEDYFVSYQVLKSKLVKLKSKSKWKIKLRHKHTRPNVRALTNDKQKKMQVQRNEMAEQKKNSRQEKILKVTNQ